MTVKPTIIPIAAGKGGVGKSLLTANLALCLSRMGRRTIAVDLDLGGANLHHFLGVQNKHPGIGDFLVARQGELIDYLVPLDNDRLHFIPGDGKTPFMANLAHTQKLKLINRILKLPADVVLLDLGAGSAFNTLDFFGLSDQGIVVTTPDILAVVSMLSFLKHALLRSMERSLVNYRSAQAVLKEGFRNPMADQVPTIAHFHEMIAKEDPAAARMVIDRHRRWRPRIIFNRGRKPEDSLLADQISQSLKGILQVEADYFGFIFEDPAIEAAMKNRAPLTAIYPDSMAAQNIARIAERIAKYWDRKIPNSAELIYAHVSEVYKKP
ncbi:MAG: P-loop NTPase [Pseudomonadota bacterium]